MKTARVFWRRSRRCSGEHKVSIARVVQKNAKTDRAELVIVTEKVKEKHMGSALCELKEMKSIFEVSSMIREY